jgi:hypothetical protein
MKTLRVAGFQFGLGFVPLFPDRGTPDIIYTRVPETGSFSVGISTGGYLLLFRLLLPRTGSRWGR